MSNFYDTLTEREIRRRQSIAEQQAAIAYATGNTVALERIQRRLDDLAGAMLKRC